MRKAFLISLALASVLVATPALAATFAGGQNYTLDKQTTLNDDLFAAGGSPTISGIILGDAILAGGTITFNGSTTNSFMAAGGTITVLGTVSGSVRSVGGTITVSGPVGFDVVAAGGTLNITNSAAVGRDVALAGGTITVDSTVGRNVTIRGAVVTINGVVDGNVDVQASRSFTLGDSAVIKGNLTYSAPDEVTKAPGATVDGIVSYNATPANDHSPAGFLYGFIGLLFLIKVLSFGAAIIIATTVFNRITSGIILLSIDDFWKNMCIGFVALIVVPFAALALLISIVGSAIAIIALCAYIALIVIAKIFAAILAGAFLSKWYSKEAAITWKWSLLGLIAVDLLAAIPVVGWVITAVLFLATLGTLASLAYYSVADAR